MFCWLFRPIARPPPLVPILTSGNLLFRIHSYSIITAEKARGRYEYRLMTWLLGWKNENGRAPSGGQGPFDVVFLILYVYVT